MTTKIVVSGTYRNRVRVNLGLFKIEGPWRETKFHEEIPVEFGKKLNLSVPIKAIGSTIRVTTKASRIDVEADTPLGTYYIFDAHPSLPNKPRAFSFQPIKGAIFAGTVALVETEE